MKDNIGERFPDNTVLLAQGIGASRAERNADFQTKHRITLPHEWWHTRDLTDDEKYDWIKEAGAEHLALAMEYGGPGVLFPEDREHDSRIYTEYRFLVAEMMRGIDPSIYTRAVSSAGIHSAEWRELEKVIDAKYGVPNMLQKISDLQERYIQQNQNRTDMTADKLSATVAQRVETELRETPWKITGRHDDPARHMGAFAAGQFVRPNPN